MSERTSNKKGGDKVDEKRLIQLAMKGTEKSLKEICKFIAGLDCVPVESVEMLEFYVAEYLDCHDRYIQLFREHGKLEEGENYAQG